MKAQISIKYYLRFTASKFFFELPIVLKTVFIRRNDSLSRGISLYPQHHVPVDDFCLVNLSIFHHEKSLKKL